MKTNKKFAKRYLDFCKRTQKFSDLKKDLDTEIESMNSLVEEPSVVNFSKRGNAKLRKFSEVLDEATKQVEELQDSTEDLVKDAEATQFSKISKIKILRREFSNLENELKDMNDEVKEVIEEAASDGQVTDHISTEVPQPGTEQPTNSEGVTTTEAATPAEPGVVEGASAEVTKKVSVNFSKDKYLSSKMKSICAKYKNFSEDFENSGDIIEEVTDEITLDEAPTPEEVKPVETPASTEEVSTPEVADADKVADVAEGIAEDIESDEFNEENALDEVESKEFSGKDAIKKLIKSFGRIKKHFDDKTEAIKAEIDATKTVDPSELTTEEAESLTSEFKTFTESNEGKLTKRLLKKFSNFSATMKKFSETKEVKTEDVVEAAEDVADTMDAVNNPSDEFKEFSTKIRKFVKMFSAEAKPTPEEVISSQPTEEVAQTTSEEVIKKDEELNSTLNTINGKIEKLDLPATVTNFAKISSKSLSKIKCFSEQDIDAKLSLIEDFAEMCKEFCDKKNMSACPKCGKEPCECTPTETTEEVVETPANTEEVITEEFSDDDEDTEEDVVIDTPVEENTPAPTEEVVETPANTEEVVETPSEETTEEEIPNDEIILKNFSNVNGAKNNNYGSIMAHLAVMH